jgi:ATP-binding protein involved in chromosome partitioning
MTAIDPRIAGMKRNLERFKLILPVMSPKGGVGKTFATALLAHILSRKYECISLFDADLTNPTLHVVLGLNAKNMKIIEERGVKPVKVNERLELMSLALFVDEYSIPLRGKDVENVIKELLAVTRWSGRILLIDTPPGFSDTHLELLKILSSVSKSLIILVTTPNYIALKSIERGIKILLLESVKLAGILGNMCVSTEDEFKIESMTHRYGIMYLGCIPYVDRIENYFGLNLANMLKHVEHLYNNIVKSIDNFTGV